ncbi:MAG TPA: Dyp-type peroxidase [Solirubrobacteraceae bacterium]|jgi:deferrochelatase/peroxidase EfeB|nr:Dyp-type peroxidase [Solirubrobacteraceae bacterium]
MSRLDRRQFVARSAALLGAAALGAGAGAAVDGAGPGGSPPASAGVLDDRGQRAGLSISVPFTGAHQAGVLTPTQAQATFVALDAIAADRLTLQDALMALGARANQLAAGNVNPLLEIDDPPADSGILGPVNAPDGLTVTVGFGASLFDGRYGLDEQRPARLTPMPSFATDVLDPAQTHGDVLVQIGANQRDTVVHTLRELLRVTRGALAVRWTIDGFRAADRGPSPHSSARNLFAFRDGTANPDVADAAEMDRLVWVAAGSGEPAWTAGGTYQVVRIIRQHVEFWDRVGLAEQQNMIGRDRDTGAPLGGTDEFEDPRYDLDPKGLRIPLDAHIRIANPRTPETADRRILRRGFNYHRGFDPAGQLDQGLVFVAFNQDPVRQFAAIQTRLATEPMIDYVTPVGGGYFFVPPGVRGPDDWVGSGLFAA